MKKSVRYIIIAIIIVIIIGVSAFAAFLLNQANNANNQQPPVTETKSQEAQEADKKADEAEKQAFEGDVDGGVASLDEAIKSTNDSQAKARYYSQKALLLYNDKKLEAALESAKAAFDNDQNAGSAAFVGQIARELGDKTTAIDYYRKAAELVDASGSPMAEKDRQYYNNVITELEAS
ncbi:MAG TPA: hypothetical protein VFT59_03120 [Candidatus Saccharimonadales bacterium]|nr:hypothetical protein [Candidatus Saccharimonadales bacterium]